MDTRQTGKTTHQIGHSYAHACTWVHAHRGCSLTRAPLHLPVSVTVLPCVPGCATQTQHGNAALKEKLKRKEEPYQKRRVRQGASWAAMSALLWVPGCAPWTKLDSAA
eukprot:583333-Pelagomonas_calceolata.AAC.2